MSFYGGWLTKKNLQRYYLVYEGILYWFADRTVCYFWRLCADQKLGASWGLDERMSIYPDRRMYLQINSPLEVFLLKTRSDEEAEGWFDALCVGIKYHSNTPDTKGPPLLLNKVGWLEVDNERKFTVIKHGKLRWQTKERVAIPEVDLDLKSCTCTASPSSGQFTLTDTKQGRSWSLQSPHGIYDTKIWIKILQNQCDGANQQQAVEEEPSPIGSPVQTKTVQLYGWLTILPGIKKKYFVLNGPLLTWYLEDPNERQGIKIDGTLHLAGSVVALPKAGPNGTFALRDHRGNFTRFKASEVESWTMALASVCKSNPMVRPTSNNQWQLAKPLKPDLQRCSGWVNRHYTQSKKVLKRFLVLNDMKGLSLKLYEREETDIIPAKEDLYLAGCVVNVLDSHTLMINTPSNSNAREDFVISLVPPEDALLAGLSGVWDTDINGLSEIINGFIFAANREIQKAFIRQEWMSGRVSRWNVITYQRQLLWFDRILPPESATPEYASTRMDLTGARVEENPRIPRGITITPVKGAATVFVVPEHSDLNEWLNILLEVSKGQGEYKKKSLTFGIPLEEMLEREGPEAEIPKMVIQCCDYVRQNGTDQKGIFRISGSTSEIQSYVDTLDEGGELDFNTHSDVHAVAGLLKLFLRKMAEPMLQFDLYEEFIYSNNIDDIKAVIPRLRPAHYNLTSYIMKFLHEMTEYADITSMDGSNLAIVFGPNILLGKGQDDLSRLQFTSLVLNCVRMMINNADLLFPNEFEVEG